MLLSRAFRLVGMKNLHRTPLLLEADLGQRRREKSFSVDPGSDEEAAGLMRAAERLGDYRERDRIRFRGPEGKHARTLRRERRRKAVADARAKNWRDAGGDNELLQSKFHRSVGRLNRTRNQVTRSRDELEDHIEKSLTRGRVLPTAQAVRRALAKALRPQHFPDTEEGRRAHHDAIMQSLRFEKGLKPGNYSARDLRPDLEGARQAMDHHGYGDSHEIKRRYAVGYHPSDTHVSIRRRTPKR